MKEGARVHHSYGSYALSTYGSYEPRRANPSAADLQKLLEDDLVLRDFAGGHPDRVRQLVQVLLDHAVADDVIAVRWLLDPERAEL